MAHLTRIGILALVVAAAAALAGDVTELARDVRSQGIVTLSAAATLVGLGLLFLGYREHPLPAHVRNVRLAALLWGGGYLLLMTASIMAASTVSVVFATIGGAASDGALVAAAWALAGGLAQRVLAAGYAVTLAGYAAALVLVLVDGPSVLGLALPGHAALTLAFALIARTLPPPGRAPFRSRRQVGRKMRGG